MTNVKAEAFKEVFEEENPELSHRYHKANNLKPEQLPIIKPVVSYEIWKKMYQENNSTQDIYDFIVENTDERNLEILENEKREEYLDKNPYHDIGYRYIEKCINQILAYNNLELEFINSVELAKMYIEEMFEYGSVKKYLLSQSFINSLIERSYITITLQSPFK